MRGREILREATRDVRSGTAWAVVFTLVFVLFVGGSVVALVADRAAAVRGAASFVSAGAATQVETAEGRIDGAACDALVRLPTVRAAGAIRRESAGVKPVVLPRSTIPTFAVSTGFSALLNLDGRADDAGLILSADVASDLGLRVGSSFTTSAGSVPAQGVYRYPNDGRDPALSYAVLAAAGPAASAPFDACWATSWPEDPGLASALGRTVLPSPGGEDVSRPSLSRLNTTLGLRFVDPGVVRPVVAQSVAFGAGVVVGAVFALRRRLMIASDRHIGMRAAAQCSSMLVQSSVWIVLGGAVLVPIVGGIVRGLASDDAGPIALSGACVFALGAAGSAIGVVGGVVAVRERALFRYFKQR